MAELSFFNPATLLSDPEVAVSRVPQQNNNGFLTGLTESIALVRQEARRKRDVDQVRREALALADYTDDKSPDLAQYLRNKAATYNPADTDPNTERQFLTKGFLELSRIEQQDRKIASDRGELKLENNWKYKLSGSEKRLESMYRDRQRWETEENDRVQGENNNRARLASQGINSPAAFKRPYPRDAEIKALESKVAQLTEAGPAEIAAMGTLGQVNKNNPYSSSSQQYPNWEAQPNQDPIDLPTGSGGQANDKSLLLPFPEGSRNLEPPVYDLENPPSSQLTEDQTLSPGDQVPESTSPTSNSIVPAGAENDPYNQAASEARELNEAANEAAKAEVDSIIDRVQANIEFFENQKTAKDLIDKRDKIKAQIDAIPKRGSALWKASVNRILRTLTDDVNFIPKRTALQEEKQVAANNAAKLTYYIKGDSSKSPIEVTRTQVGGNLKYTAKDVNGKENDITIKIKNGDYLPLTTESKTDVTVPGQSMGGVINYLRQLK